MHDIFSYWCRTKEIFDIIIDFPDSTGALQDLKVSPYLCIMRKLTCIAGVPAACRSADGVGAIAEESVSIYIS